MAIRLSLLDLGKYYVSCLLSIVLLIMTCDQKLSIYSNINLILAMKCVGPDGSANQHIRIINFRQGKVMNRTSYR